MNASFLKQLEDEISKVVDSWVSGALRDRFMRNPVGQKPRSLWDRLKQGVANWWWGPKGDKYNPYRWRNRFGDELGSKVEQAQGSETFDPLIFTLHDYMEIRNLVESIEMRLDESEGSKDEFDKLRLMNILKSTAADLKGRLYSAIKNKIAAALPSGYAKSDAGSGGGQSFSTNIHVDPNNLPPNMRLPTAEPEPEQKKDAEQSRPTKTTVKKTPPPGKTRVGGDEKKPKSPTIKPAANPKVDSPASPAGESEAERGANQESSGIEEEDNIELRGFFYTEKDEPVDFMQKIKGFLKTEKYAPYADSIKKWWMSQIDEAKKASGGVEEQRNWLRAHLWSKIVTGGEFLKIVSDATGFSKNEVKRDAVGYLKSDN